MQRGDPSRSTEPGRLIQPPAMAGVRRRRLDPGREAPVPAEGTAMIRLFVAVSFPDDVRRSLAALCAGVPGARWANPDQFHLTLRFVGEVAGRIARAVYRSEERRVGNGCVRTCRARGSPYP